MNIKTLVVGKLRGLLICYLGFIGGPVAVILLIGGRVDLYKIGVYCVYLLPWDFLRQRLFNKGKATSWKSWVYWMGYGLGQVICLIWVFSY